MNKDIIIEMGTIQAELDRLNKRMDELKALARAEANGEQACFTADNISVTVTKPGKPSVTLDTTKFKAKAPKLYEEVFGKYSKVGSPKAAAVKVYANK